jgi:hypothetical protein
MDIIHIKKKENYKMKVIKEKILVEELQGLILGKTIDFLLGILEMQTFKKLPIPAPMINIKK